MTKLTLGLAVLLACVSNVHANENELSERQYAYSKQCKTAADANNLDNARLYCGKSNEIQSSAVNHVNLGSALYANGKYTEAQLHFTEAVNINPMLAVAHFDLGRVCDVLARKECALEQYQQAAKLGDDDAMEELAARNTLAQAVPKP